MVNPDHGAVLPAYRILFILPCLSLLFAIIGTLAGGRYPAVQDRGVLRIKGIADLCRHRARALGNNVPHRILPASLVWQPELTVLRISFRQSIPANDMEVALVFPDPIPRISEFRQRHRQQICQHFGLFRGRSWDACQSSRPAGGE